MTRAHCCHSIFILSLLSISSLLLSWLSRVSCSLSISLPTRHWTLSRPTSASRLDILDIKHKILHTKKGIFNILIAAMNILYYNLTQIYRRLISPVSFGFSEYSCQQLGLAYSALVGFTHRMDDVLLPRLEVNRVQ